MRESPSIVPDALNRDVYLVLDNFGGALGGLAWPETVVAHTDRAIGAPLREPRARPQQQRSSLPFVRGS